MPLPPWSETQERRPSFWRSSLRSCMRVMCCGHLQFMWRILMVVTILCVGLQLLGAARHSRSVSPADEHLMRSLSVHQQNGEALQPVSASIGPDQIDYRLHQQKNGKGERWGQIIEPGIKLLDTTPTGHHSSTTNNIKAPNRHHLPAKAHLPRALTEMEMDPKQSTTLNQKYENIQITPHEDSAKELHKSELFRPDDIPMHLDIEPFHLLNQNKSACHPKKHIVFLKTHKTASSTILNILFRYGDSRNLTFALPVNMYSQLYYPNFFQPYFVEGVNPRRVTEFHIMCSHMRFQGDEVRKVMPSDTFYFSILRNPTSMMESLFTYYKAIQAFHNFNTLQDFLLDGGRSYNSSYFGNHYAQNILTFDFGLDNSAPANKSELDKVITSLIATVEKNFHLMLIAEYFDESMVLLKHALCWTLEDVVSFRMNSRSKISRNKLTPEMSEKVKQWNSLDWNLYQHFNRTFWQRIDKVLGRVKLQEEVKLLRARRAELEQTCLLGGGAVHPEQVHDSSVKPFQYGAAVIQGYNIRPGLNSDIRGLCQRMITPELQYTSALYTKQFPDLAAKHKAKMTSTTRSRLSKRNSTSTNSALKHCQDRC